MIDLSINTSLCRHPDLIASPMDGDLVMMSIERGEYFGIGGVGCRIWELLEHTITVHEIIDTLCAEYEIDEATCRTDVLKFAQELLHNELVAFA
ncbi:MAG: lasso peptide biosynthesis PqqD family chaperone [Methylobacter sp.]